MDLQERHQSIEKVPVLAFWFKICLHYLQETRLSSDCTSSQISNKPKICFRGTIKQKLRKILRFSTEIESSRRPHKQPRIVSLQFCGCSFGVHKSQTQYWNRFENPVKRVIQIIVFTSTKSCFFKNKYNSSNTTNNDHLMNIILNTIRKVIRI